MTRATLMTVMCVAVLVAVTVQVQAMVVNADGHHLTTAAHPGAILDTLTNWLWLDATETINRSVGDVSSQLGPGGEFEGYRLATRLEIHNLFTSAGLTLTESDLVSNGWVDDAAGQLQVQQFVNIYGQTDFNITRGSLVWAADDDSQAAMWPYTFPGQPVDNRYWLGDAGTDPSLTGTALDSMGVALVRPVPEPSVLGLVVLGLTGLAGRRSRRTIHIIRGCRKQALGGG